MQKKNKRLRSRHLFFLHVLTRKLICEANQKSCEAASFRVNDKKHVEEKQAAAKQRAFEFMIKNMQKKNKQLRSSELSRIQEG